MFTLVASLAQSYLMARALGKAVTAAEEWAYGFYKLMMSIFISTFVVFTGTWGGTAIVKWMGGLDIHIALGVGFAYALAATSAIDYTLWITSPYTKGITVVTTKELADAATNINTVSTTRN